MGGADRMMQFAQANDLRVRMHNLIWGNQQPTWVNTLLTSAASGNTADAATLRSAITNRVNYYVRDRASRRGWPFTWVNVPPRKTVDPSSETATASTLPSVPGFQVRSTVPSGSRSTS